MKKLLLVLFTVVAISCGSTKNLTHDQKQNIVDLAVEDLGLNVSVEIVELNTSRYYIQPNSTLKAVVGKSGKDKYKIKIIKELTTSSIILILCHEVWHIKQYESRSFEVISTKDAIFNGRLIKNYRGILYEQRPWEVEAHIEGRKLAWRIKKKLKQ